MAIIAKFTRTLPAPSATIGDGFVFMLSAGWFTQSNAGPAGSPIDGGTNSLANGGGDMQIFSDTGATTRLPIEVVIFVTGGSPVAQVWVRTPNYTAGDTITIGKDNTQTVQPVASAAFGRNATWIDCAVASHDTISDSTGGTTVTVTGSIAAELGVFGNTGGGGSNANTTDYVTFTGISVSSEWTIMAWVETNFGNARFSSIGQIGSTGNQANLGLDGGNKATYLRNGTSPVSTNNYNGGTSYEFFAARESSALGNLIWIGNGTDSTVTAYNSSFPVLDRARIFQSADDTPFGTSGIIISEVRIFTIGLTDEHIDSIHSNQNDPDNFGTSSEYVLVGGGGISVTGSTPALSYSAINSSINLTGEVAISGTTTNYFYSSVNSSVSLVPSIDIIGNTTSYYYDSVNISIDLIGLISVVGLSTNYSYSAASASIALQGSISFTTSSTNYAYNALNGTIILKGPVVLNPKNLIRVSRENNTIRVKRNNNIVRVR